MEVLYTAPESTLQSSHKFIQFFCSAHAGLTGPSNSGMHLFVLVGFNILPKHALACRLEE